MDRRRTRREPAYGKEHSICRLVRSPQPRRFLDVPFECQLERLAGGLIIVLGQRNLAARERVGWQVGAGAQVLVCSRTVNGTGGLARTRFAPLMFYCGLPVAALIARIARNIDVGRGRTSERPSSASKEMNPYLV